jgi:hypothetical protein
MRQRVTAKCLPKQISLGRIVGVALIEQVRVRMSAACALDVKVTAGIGYVGVDRLCI